MRWRRRRAAKIDTNRWPLIYVGPTTRHGLRTNSPCRPSGTRQSNGMRGIVTMEGNVWQVPPAHVVSSALR